MTDAASGSVAAPNPVAAAKHGAASADRGISAATMLVVYLVLLLAVPSYVTLGGLGSLGRPALIWGLVLLFWWLLSRLQVRAFDVPPVTQPVRLAFAAAVVIILLSFAAAMLRGQPPDQVSPAVTALIRTTSWAGVLLVTMDGVRTHNDAARVLRGITFLVGGLAALGLAQFVIGQSLLDWITTVPGVAVDADAIATRGSFTRASGTATHPLEYGTVLTASLPVAVVVAVRSGFGVAPTRHRVLWWLPVLLIVGASLVAVSRSAIIGLAVAVIATMPALSRSLRWVIAAGGALLAAAVFAVVPGMLGTLVGLFAGASQDPSAQSRSNALARVPEFLSSSPWIGQGFGVFLPRYYIFDNGWALLAVEVGVLGLVAFACLGIGAIASAAWAGRTSPFRDTRSMAKAIAASMVTIIVMFLLFDGLAFPMSAGLFFLIAGMAAVMRTIAVADTSISIGAPRRQARASKQGAHRLGPAAGAEAAKPRSAPSA